MVLSPDWLIKLNISSALVNSGLKKLKCYINILKSITIYLYGQQRKYKLVHRMLFPQLCLFLFISQVFLTEYAGPLIIYLMFYFRVPFIYQPKYDFTTSKHWVVQ